MNGWWPRFDSKSFRKTKASEYATRFLFGGAIGSVAFYAGHRFGPHVGGVLLAFPALLPASLTLAKEHEARDSAIVQARAAALGALSLIAFAMTARAIGPRQIGLGLPLALLIWFGCSYSLWLLTVWMRRRRMVAESSARTRRGEPISCARH